MHAKDNYGWKPIRTGVYYRQLDAVDKHFRHQIGVRDKLRSVQGDNAFRLVGYGSTVARAEKMAEGKL